MPVRAEEQKQQIIADIAARAGDRGETVRSFVEQYYAHVTPEDLRTRRPEQLLAMALSLWDFAQRRQPGQVSLRIADGPRPARTIVEIVNDDMPFLVDSLSAAIIGKGLSLLLIIHPILTVKRDPAGRLVALSPAGTPPAGDGSTRAESMMRLEIAEALDAAARGQLAAELEEALADVRHAVADWPKMRDAVAGTRDALKTVGPAIATEDLRDAEAFLHWLDADHFVYLGYREYRFGAGGETGIDFVPGSGLGILRDDAVSVFEGLRRFTELPAYVRDFLMAPQIIELTKSSQPTRIHRAVPMDAIGIKMFDAEGRPVGLRLLVGLFTALAYRVSTRSIPMVARKVEHVLKRIGADPQSHDGFAVLHVIEDFPRDELFQIGEDQLFEMVQRIRDIEQRPHVGLFVRRDPFGRFYSCFVFVPRDRYNRELRERIAAILTDALQAGIETYHIQLDDQPLARLLFFMRADPDRLQEFDVDAIEGRLVAAARNWSDGLRDALIMARSEDAATPLFQRYRAAFPAAYRERYAPETAPIDIELIESLRASLPFALRFDRREGTPDQLSFGLYRPDQPMPLSDVLPLLEHMGLRVISEIPFKIALPDRSYWHQEFGVACTVGTVDIPSDRARFEEAFRSILAGEAESDGFNQLILGAGLDFREVSLLRLYARFLRQAGSTFSQAYMEAALIRHAGIAGSLAALFKRRFDPKSGNGAAETEQAAAKIEKDLDAVTSLDEDRILRNFLVLIRHSLRTNYFQTEDGAPKPYLSVKLASRDLELLPLPRPMIEIFVSSPAMEGVHLRNGKIARGGIRWSDRKEDFRTEILGLMKAQVVKNAVIVPTGSKGGFIVKRATADTEALQREAVLCYRTLLRGMLDLTDNVVGDRVVPPADTVRYDEDDPYLVVAADKGTSSFSDIANGLAADYRYWLGDAFASGGSEGYDHKAMGITARGAWETVKRHFRERHLDIQSQDFTVVGIGDMSGDVFGNGMLRSEHTLLLAAFDHRDIFIDPNPDPVQSFAERKRLFDLPRSSWADYAEALISEGGGVYSRAMKSIPLSPQIQQRIGVTAKQLPPAELIQALLRAPVDLLWFGGIGTYVKASSERNADVGDRANDALRINGGEVGASVIGEGANLGVTQLGRIEYALKGGRINTDAIDNSAGVDTSDREVNIKIALDGAVAQGALDIVRRNTVLHELTDEVATLVLADNYAQGMALTLAQTAQRERFDADIRLMRSLERRRILDRAVEFLPDDETLATRAKAGMFFTRPELSVLLAYAKNSLADALIGSDLADDPQLRNDLFAYFPPSLVANFQSAIEAHRLKHEIVATVAANDLVNRAGIAFANEMVEESGRSAGDVVRAFAIAGGVYALGTLWDRVNALDNRMPAALQSQLLLAGRNLLRSATAWFLRMTTSLNLKQEIDAYRPGIAALGAEIGTLIGRQERAALEKHVETLTGAGAPADLAREIAGFEFLGPALDIVRLARDLERDPVEIGRRFFELGARLRLDSVILAAQMLETGTLWERRAATTLVEELYARQAALTRRAVASAEDFEAFLAAHDGAVRRFGAIADEIAAQPSPDLARLTVANQALRALMAP